MRAKYKNEHFFDCIDTEEKAYWLGFLFADGCLCGPTRMIQGKEKPWYRIEISLIDTDSDHLEKLRKALNMEAEVKIGSTNFKNSNRCRLGWNSKHMWTVLNSYGCTPRKSSTLKFPNKNIFKDENLIRDFIRGYVDGDGCLSYTDANHKKALVSILGTFDMLSNIQHNIPLMFENKIYDKSEESVKVLSFNGKTAFFVANYIYKGCNIKLERKYNKYLDYCRLYLEEYGLRLGKYGESCNANTVVNSEITKGSESPYSVETE